MNLSSINKTGLLNYNVLIYLALENLMCLGDSALMESSVSKHRQRCILCIYLYASARMFQTQTGVLCLLFHSFAPDKRFYILMFIIWSYEKPIFSGNKNSQESRSRSGNKQWALDCVDVYRWPGTWGGDNNTSVISPCGPLAHLVFPPISACKEPIKRKTDLYTGVIVLSI